MRTTQRVYSVYLTSDSTSIIDCHIHDTVEAGTLVYGPYRDLQDAMYAFSARGKVLGDLTLGTLRAS